MAGNKSNLDFLRIDSIIKRSITHIAKKREATLLLVIRTFLPPSCNLSSSLWLFLGLSLLP